MPKTYEPITTQTLSSNVSSVTFSSIPSTFTDLQIVMEGTNTGSLIKSIRFNGDTSALYSATVLYGTGSATASARYSFSYLDVVNATTNRYMTIVNVMNYASTNVNKTYLSRHSCSAVSAEMVVGLYRSTNAITQIDIIGSANNFASGSVFTLYGVKAA